MTEPHERKAFSHKAVFISLALTLTLGFTAGIYILTHFATYEPKALERVPEDALFVARLNVQQAVVHSPLTRFLFPVLERGREGPESRAKHLERKTTLELWVDVRELIFAELKDARWIIIAGGFLRSDEVLAGVGRMLDDEGVEYAVKDEVLVRPSGVAFCVAENGTLVLARTKEDAKRSCTTPADAPSWAAGLSRPGVALSVYAAEFGRIPPEKSASGPLLGGQFLVNADSHFPTWAELKLAKRAWTGVQVTQLLASKSNDFSYLVPLGALRSVSSPGPTFHVQGNLSREQFDESVARLAARIEKALADAGELGRGP